MKKLLALFSVAFCLAFASQGYSQCYECDVCDDVDTGVYVGAFGGTNWLNFKNHHDVKGKFDVGYTGALSLGYKFHNGFRVEGEVSYRHNKLKSFDVGSLSMSDFHAKGHTTSTSIMGNVLYDFDFGSCVTPYIGAGIGYTNLHAKIEGHDNFSHEKFSGSEKGLAVQGIVGASYALCEKTAVGVEYRYFKAREHADDHSVGISLRRFF